MSEHVEKWILVKDRDQNEISIMSTRAIKDQENGDTVWDGFDWYETLSVVPEGHKQTDKDYWSWEAESSEYAINTILNGIGKFIDQVVRVEFSIGAKCYDGTIVKDYINDGYEIPQKIIYPYYLKSRTWKKIRRKRIELDGYQCKLCGSAKNLNVHHITYENLGCEDIDDLITVCEECHQKLHEKDIKEKNMKFEDIVNKEVERRIAEMKEKNDEKIVILITKSLKEQIYKETIRTGLSRGALIRNWIEKELKENAEDENNYFAEHQNM